MVLHGAIPGYGQRCKRVRAASEDLVRHVCFQAEAFAAKDRSLCPFLVNGLKTAVDVNGETNTTDTISGFLFGSMTRSDMTEESSG
jgi:hypothetical protein